MSHLAQESRARSSAGNERAAIRWWNGLTGWGAAVLSGTTVQSPIWFFGRGEMTTTGRLLVISGGVNPVLKSHINSVPGCGWYRKAIEAMPAERRQPRVRSNSAMNATRASTPASGQAL